MAMVRQLTESSKAVIAGACEIGRSTSKTELRPACKTTETSPSTTRKSFAYDVSFGRDIITHFRQNPLHLSKPFSRSYVLQGWNLGIQQHHDHLYDTQKAPGHHGLSGTQSREQAEDHCDDVDRQALLGFGDQLVDVRVWCTVQTIRPRHRWIACARFLRIDRCLAHEGGSSELQKSGREFHVSSSFIDLLGQSQ